MLTFLGTTSYTIRQNVKALGEGVEQVKDSEGERRRGWSRMGSIRGGRVGGVVAEGAESKGEDQIQNCHVAEFLLHKYKKLLK